MKINRKLSCVFAVASLVLVIFGFTARADAAAFTASANGKYANLVQELTCPADRAKYGNFNDYGYWGGGSWCGKMGAAGYWVWLYPTWYVWATKVR